MSSPRLPRRVRLALGLLAVPLAGCSLVHDRQAVDSRGSSRTAARRPATRQAAKERAPVVRLRVDPVVSAEAPTAPAE